MIKILVIGDSCIDVFKYGDCKRICPEAPVPVFQPTKNFINSGMTSNVHINLKALNIASDIITNAKTPKKIRFIDEISNQMLMRVDKNDTIKRIERKRLEKINFKKYKAVIISDYNKGFLIKNDISYIAKNHPLTFMDTKKKLGSWSNEITYIKINSKEYEENIDYLNNGYNNNIIITKGSEGAVLNFRQVFPIENKHLVRDLTGAGDTFLAALVAKYVENYDICEAINFANKCASWAVTQKGVAIIDVTHINNEY